MRSTRRRRHFASDALAHIAAEPWSILPEAMQTLVADLTEMARTGRRPQARTAPEANSESPKFRVVGSVAVLPITGVIRPRPDFYTRWLGGTACSDVAAAINEAANSETVERIILRIDSPGGSVLGVQETFEQIYIARGKKPIDAIAEGTCASAAYYLACGAHRIHATPSSDVGSTGVMAMHFDYSEMLKQIGIAATHIQFGKHKTDGSPWKPLDAQGKASLQQLVNDYGDQFFASIAKGRGIPVATVAERYGQGKVFVASRALSVGMIDSVTNFEALCKTEPAKSTARAQKSQDTTAAEPARDNPISTSASQTASPPNRSTPLVDPRLKNMLSALGLISADASDDVAKTALASFCFARGVAVPESTDAALKLLAGALVNQNTSPTTGAAAQPAAAGQPATTGASQAATQTPADPRAAAMADARQAMADVRAAAALINAGRPQPVITTEMVETGVDAILAGTSTLQTLQASWQQTLSTDQQQRSISIPAGQIQTGQSGEDVFGRNAALVIAQRLGCSIPAEQANAIEPSMRSMSLADMAEACARFQGRSLTGMTREERIVEMMQHSGTIFFGSGGSSYNRPGDFPNLLGNIAGRILDSGYELAEATYPRWTAELPDRDDLLPHTVMAGGQFTDLAAIGDDEEVKQLAFTEELKGFVQAARYANAAGLTAVMVANDNLDAFAQQLRSLGMAHELKKNRLAVGIIVANAALVDGVALFDDSTHKNVVASGGGKPDATQWEKMVLLHRLQTGIGTDVTISSRPRIFLGPPSTEVAARQLLLPFGNMPEQKTPATDANLNVFRGTVEHIVVDPMLEAFSSKIWYTFDQPSRIRTIVRVSQTGYRQGRRESWWNPARGTMYYKLEGRFGFAAVGYRGIARNKGEA